VERIRFNDGFLTGLGWNWRSIGEDHSDGVRGFCRGLVEAVDAMDVNPVRPALLGGGVKQSF